MNAICLLKILSAKLLVNIVDKEFQHFNDIYFRKFCMNIRVVFKEVYVKIPIFIFTDDFSFFERNNCL